MCRWFAYLGDEPQLLEDVLLRPSHSIVKQIDEHFLPNEHTSFKPASPSLTNQLPSSALSKPDSATAEKLAVTSANDSGSPNPLTNMDGFGVGWWSDAFETFENGLQGKEGMRPTVYKNIRPPLNDLVLKSFARGIQTRSVVAHIRAGTGLTPVVETNCHPFPFGRHLFCHNGVLGSFHLFKPKLLSLLPLRYQMAILGTTDSEHIAALYFLHLCGEHGDWEAIYPISKMVDAMKATVIQLEELKSTAEGKAGTTEHNALNLLVSSGASLVALRYASPVSREPPSLYYSTTAGATLNRKFKGHPDEGKPGADVSEGSRGKEEHGRHVIVGSEPNTFNADEWTLVKRSEMVIVGEDMGFEVRLLGL